MGYIKEPAGIDFVVESTPLTLEDRKKISEVIAYYKETGRKKLLPESTAKTRLTKSNRKKTIA